MPLYDYFCPLCEKVYEVLKFRSDPEPICEIHHKEMIKDKIISGTFIRKGAGIYSIDTEQHQKPGDWPGDK